MEPTRSAYEPILLCPEPVMMLHVEMRKLSVKQILKVHRWTDPSNKHATFRSSVSISWP